jgi:serine/threonine-protein kinase
MKVERIGKYRIIAQLGQGGMATVYLSVVPSTVGVNKLLVVKLLREELSGDPDFLAMFLNEARLAARLNHANVVQTYEVGLADGHHYLAMDYLDGQPLHAILRKAGRSGVPLDVHLRILADMLAGLHYAHTLTDFDGSQLSVVHRDVSPQNVFVTYDGQVKVVDFGIAKAVGVAGNTQSGVFKGKLAYVAPEQAGGDQVDCRADLFSVGVMLWEAIAGKRFAQGDSQTVILGRRLAGNEPRIRDAVPNVDPELADICERGMAHDPAHRYATAEQFHSAIEDYLARFSRRIGNREVGQFVGGLFREERDRIRAVIDDQMKRVQRETSTELPMPMLDAFQGARDLTPITTIERREAALRAAAALRGPVGGDESVTGSLSRSHSQGTLIAAHITQTGLTSRGAGRNLIIALAGLAVALAAALGVALVLRAPPPPKPTPSDSPPAVAPQVKLSITYGPAGAVAKLDGVPLAESPFVAQVPRDGSMHRVEVTAPGRKPETRMVSYEKDVVVAVALVDAPPPEPAASVTSAATTASAAPPPVDSSRRVAGPMPSAKPRGGKGGGIDEKDPYKQ